MKNKIMLLIAFLVLLQGCKEPEFKDANTCNTIDCDKFIDYHEEFRLDIEGEPALDKAITARAAYNPGDYEGMVDVVIEIPEGYEFVSGNKEFNGYVSKNQNIDLNAELKGIKTGGWIITAYAQREKSRLEKGKYAGISTGKFKELPILK